MERRQLVILIVIIIAVSVLVATTTIVATTSLGVRQPNTLQLDEYEIFLIEGMPCVRVNRIDGVSCDWSRWDGR